ncbi:MAG: ABC transporter permease [Gemmatimonadetes bacterium]|nr:ABC transporter permease [Gemmatimonadota bacterium]
MNTLLNDLRYAYRMLLKSPVVSVVAVLSLSIGIAVNSMQFSIFNSFMLEPFPYHNQDELLLIWQTHRSQTGNDGVSAANFLDIREAATTFRSLDAYSIEAANLTGVDEPLQINAVTSTPGLFRTMGVQPSLGRDFRDDEGVDGANRVAILHHDFWQARFLGDPGVLGKVVTVDGTQYSVVGVMPEDFDLFPANVELWTPSNLADMTSQRDVRAFIVMGRVDPGVSQDQVQAEMSSIFARLEAQYPEANEGYGINVDTLSDLFPGETDAALMYILTTVTILILLIACANVANLLLARAEDRQKEVAVRTALGAGRRRLIRQLLTESVFMALVAGVLGTIMSIKAVALLQTVMPPELPGAFLPRLKPEVLLATLGVSLLAGIAFGLAPALYAVGGDLRDSLTDGSRGGTVGVRRRRLRNAFVIGEIAVALAMLSGAGMLTEAFNEIVNAPPGYAPERLLTFQLSLPEAKYPDEPAMLAMYEEVLRRLEEVPGVESATAMASLPRSRGNPSTAFTVDGRPEPEPNERSSALYQTVDPGYLKNLGVELVAGRFLLESDGVEASGVAVVTRSFASKFFADEDPLGHRLTMRGESREIVGVVGDVLQSRMPDDDGFEGSDPLIFLPMAQQTRRSMAFAVRSASDDPAALSADVRTAVWSVDPDQPIGLLKTMDDHVRESLSGPITIARFLTIFGVIAMALSAIGIYGVIAHSVSQQTREIGIRMALGAEQGDVVRRITVQGLTLSGIGILIGLPLAWAMTKVIASSLNGIADLTAGSFPLILISLTTVAMIASYLPARRAAAVEPVRALQSD